MGLFNKSTKRSYSVGSAEDNKDVPGWLKMLQENSWELEILISGGAIFSLFGLSDLVTYFFRGLSNTTNFNGQVFLYIFTMLATKALTLGFIIHILLRSLWISLVALSSTFSEGDNKRKIIQAKPFSTTNHVDLPRYIIKLDKLSAWMIYNTFNMVFVIAGWLLLFFALSRLENIQNSNISFWLEPLAIVAFVIYIVDFLLFSSLRKIPYLSYVVYPLFIIFDIISLRFIYQRGIDYLAQHVARWKIALFYICFVFCALIFTYLSVQKRLHWPNIFDSRRYKELLTVDNEFHTLTYYRSSNAEGTERVSIQSDIITEPVLNLFIAYSIRYDEFVDQIKDEDQRYFQNIFSIYVDDSLYTKQKFYSTTLYGTGPNDRGISTYIDISSFKNGLHELSINIKNGEGDDHAIIPFWLHKETFE